MTLSSLDGPPGMIVDTATSRIGRPGGGGTGDGAAAFGSLGFTCTS